MSLSKVAIEKLKEDAKIFDYIRFTGSDLNGIPRGISIAGRFVNQHIESGIGIFCGTFALGPSSELPVMSVIKEKGYCNIQLKPACTKISKIQWCEEEKYSIGEIICEPVWADGTVQEASPSVFQFGCLQKMFFDFEKHLRAYGVDIYSTHHEYGPGQFEYTLDTKYGIESPDMAFKLKEALKELSHQCGNHVTFMTCPFANDGLSNGGHFNFSIWDEAGRNIFYDPAKPNNLSDQALYFIGGFLKHLKALTAFYSPTANCYRRLHNVLAPDLANWDIENRFMALRVKNNSEKGTYFESRSPSGACNPYLGIDGMVNKIKAPPPGQVSDIDVVPYKLEEALEALEADQYIVDSLGKELIEWFIRCKKEVDIAKFGNHNMNKINIDEVEKERLEYFNSM